MQRSADSPNDVLSIFPEELSGVQKTYNPDLAKQSYAFSVTCFHIYPGWFKLIISKITRTFATAGLMPRRKSPKGLNTRCGPAAMQGRTFSFLSPTGRPLKKRFVITRAGVLFDKSEYTS